MSAALRQMCTLPAVDLANLPKHFVAIFRRGGKYAFARGEAECLFIETSSNLDLTGDQRLTAAEETALKTRVWHEPNLPWVPGWFREFPWPVSGAAALTAAEMLIEVIEKFAAPADEPLEVVRIRPSEQRSARHRIRAQVPRRMTSLRRSERARREHRRKRLVWAGRNHQPGRTQDSSRNCGLADAKPALADINVPAQSQEPRLVVRLADGSHSRSPTRDHRSRAHEVH